MFLPYNFFPSSIFKRAKKMSKKILDYRVISRTAKSPIFSTISFAAIFFIIYADSFMSSISMGPADLGSKEIFEALKAPPSIKAELRLTLPAVPLVAKQEKVAEVESESVDPLIPPFNVTRDVRIAWLRRKLPELEILNSNDLSQKFHGRILEFYNNKCTVQFFMTWLSPAKTFGPRQFLAVDSLFKTNPRACLTIVSHTMDSVRGYTILKPVLDLGFKVLTVTPDLPFLVKKTPAEPWLDELKSGRRDPGDVPLFINLSNLIRVAMLYKYGGAYMDSDFILLKDFAGLRNAVGAQSVDKATKKWTRMNGAVMIFDMNHPILLDFLREFATTFNGNKWGHNGPYLVSRVIEKVGNTPGYNITVLPPQAFYPVGWIKIRRLFRKPANEADWRWVEETLAGLTESYALHLWDKTSRNLIIEDGSVMDRLISEHCAVCQRINHS